METATPMGSMVFTGMAALAQMELEIARERINDSMAKRWVACKDLDGRRQTFTDSQIRSALRLIESEEPTTQVARDMGMSRIILYRRIRELPQRTMWGSCSACIAGTSGGVLTKPNGGIEAVWSDQGRRTG